MDFFYFVRLLKNKYFVKHYTTISSENFGDGGPLMDGGDIIFLGDDVGGVDDDDDGDVVVVVVLYSMW